MRLIAARTCAARICAALTLAALTAACDVFAPAGPDPDRPSLFGASARPMYRPPAQPAAAPQAPTATPDAAQGTWGPALLETPRNDLLRPYPSQQQVLQQQQMQLNQGIRQQDTNRDSLGQQLQQGVMRDQLDAQRLQQQIERDRARN
jgi:hypothetical protein